MKKTEYDLLLAIMQVARGDTGAGGLVPLTGKTVPVIRWRDRIREGNEPPIIACQIFLARRNTGAPEKLICEVQFDAVVPEQSEGLENQLIERLEGRLLPQNFLAEGIDVDPNPGARRQLSPLEEGRRRLGLDYQMTMKR